MKDPTLFSIPVFKLLPKETLEELGERGIPQVLKSGEKLVQYGQKMSSLFLIVDGTIEVCTKNFQETITTLTTGATVGEMSLIDGSTASACLRGGPDGAKLLEVPKEAFDEVVLKDHSRSAPFFKNIAVILSKRLRNTNESLEKKLEELRTSLKEILESTDILSKTHDAKASVDDIGGTIGAHITASVPIIEKFMEDHPDIDTTPLKDVVAEMEKVMMDQLHHFDRSAQKLGIVLQTVENIRRSLANEELQEIKGDIDLFDREKEGTVQVFDFG